MPRLDITTIIGCSVQCNFCPQTPFVRAYMKKSKVKALTVDSFKAMLQHVPLNVDLVFAGFSEPWLNPQCTEMVLDAYRSGYENIYVHTTLVGMATADIDALEHIPFKDVVIHLPSTGKIENIKVDEKYLSVLRRLRESRIQAKYRYHGKELHPEVRPFMGNEVNRILTTPRSVNIPESVDIRLMKKKKGVLTCIYDSTLHFNELLPNGDVLLCCHDWSMRHVLGNLLEQDYESLFQGEEFLRVQKELKEESSDIICRGCLMSRQVNAGRNYWIDLFNTDFRIILLKSVAFLTHLPVLNSRFSKRLLRRLGITKTKIDLGYWTLND